MGSDTGNSIRGPESHLALFGIRSTLGLSSRYGVIPLAYDRDIAGPMTRTVTDAAKVLSVVAGYDASDSYSVLGKEHVGVLRALLSSGSTLSSGARKTSEKTDPEIAALFEQALVDLHDSGAVLVEDFQIRNLSKHIAANNFCARFRYDALQPR